MHIDRRDLDAVSELVARAGLDEVVLRRDGEELVVRAKPLVAPEITLEDAVTYRWPDGDWIVEAHYALHNPGTEPLRVLVSTFGIGGAYAPWPPVSTLGNLVLAPGARHRGVLGWFASRHTAQPTSAAFHWSVDGGRTVGWTAEHAVRLDEARSARAAPTPPTVETQGPPPLPAGCRLSLGAGEVFRWSDGDWIVRVPVRIANEGDAPAHFPRAALFAVLDGRAMYPWPPAADFGEVETIPAGGVVEKRAAWFCSGSAPQPTRVTVVCGPDGARLVEQTLDLALTATA